MAPEYSTIKQRKKRAVLTICTLIALFLIPYLLAKWFYTHNYHFKQTTNYGHLIQPPLSLNKLKLMDAAGFPVESRRFQHKWVLMLISPTTCGKVCEKNLYNMRQVRIALGKNRQRVTRILVTLSHQKHDQHLQNLLSKQYLGTSHVLANQHELKQFLHRLPSQKLALTEGYLYLVDPLGNVMMSYPPNANPSLMLRDLQHLLKISQIG